MRFKVAVLIVLAVLLGSATRPLAAPSDSQSEATRVDKIFQPFDTPTSPGCAVAVMKGGQIVYERGYGMADLDHDVKITPATVFNVGSIAKQFTAAATLMLVQEGKISLDDSIRKYVPEVPDFGVPVTLRQMLHHTSGIRDYQQLLWLDGWRLDSPDLVTEGDIFYIMSRQKELNFPPGSDFAYSNTNYVLLAQVVSRVSKQSFPDFTATRLFQPLRMSHTHFRNDHGEIIKNVAYSYLNDDGIFHLRLPNYDNFGDTDLFTTVEDLARWDENFYTASVGGPQVVKQLQEPGQLNDGTRLIYAEGMFVSTGAAGALKVAETGDAGDAGYSANVSRFSDYHFSVATLCNNRPIDSTDLSHRVADIYLHGKLSAALAAEAGPADSFHLDRKQLATNAGTYVDKSENLALKIEQRGDSLWGESFTGPSAIGPAQLEALSESRFRGVGMKEIDFGADPNHRELTVKRVGMRDIRFRRVADYKPTAAELREFAGEYSSKELDVPYYVTFAKDSIVLHPPKMPEQPLQALTNDLFICDGMRVRFARDPKQHVSGFLMSGRWNRVQNLRFERVGQP